MKAVARALLVILATHTGALAEVPPIDVKTENVLRKNTWVEAHFSVHNTGDIPVKSIIVNCTFFDKDQKPLANEIGAVSNVRPNEKAFGKAMARYGNGMTGAECRLDNAYGF